MCVYNLSPFLGGIRWQDGYQAFLCTLMFNFLKIGNKFLNRPPPQHAKIVTSETQESIFKKKDKE